MKKTLLFIAVILAVLASFVYYKLSSTGYFRSIENTTNYTATRSFDIPGSEDFAISREDSFLLISSDDRAARLTNVERKGGIYMLDLKTPNASPKLISGGFQKPFFPHGISLVRLDSASYKLFVINHVDERHYIEIFQLKGEQLIHEQSLKDDLLASPNDLVAIDEHRFYYTNDHLSDKGFSKFAATYLGKADANVGYYDGQKFSIVAEGFHYANGINFDSQKRLLYVASMLKFKVKVFHVNQDGNLDYVEDLACHAGVDSIELDDKSNHSIGAHPDFLTA